MWSHFVKRWSGIPMGYNIVSGGEEDVEDLITQEHTVSSFEMTDVHQTNTVLSPNDDRFLSVGVGDGGIKGRSGVEDVDLCNRDHAARRAHADVKRTAGKPNGVSKLGAPAQQFVAAQKRAGLTTQRKSSAEGLPRNSSIFVPKVTANEDGGGTRRAQSFSVRRGPANHSGSRLMQPGFRTGKQYGASNGMKPAKGAETGSLGSLVSTTSGGSGDVPNKALQIVEGHFSAEPSPTAVSKAGHRVHSLRSKSVGRGTAKTADKASSARSAGENSKRLQQQQRQSHSDNESTALKPPPGRDCTRVPIKEVASGNKTGKSGPTPVTANRGSTKADPSSNSPSNARPTSVHAAPAGPARSSGIPRPKQPQQSHLARIASRLASLVNYHVGGGGGGKGARNEPVAPAAETQALLSSKSSTPSRPMSPSSQASAAVAAVGGESSVSPVFVKRALASPTASRIPRPTSSVGSSRRSSTATSPEPETHPPQTSNCRDRTSRGNSPDPSSTRRSSTPSVPALAEKSLKAVSSLRQTASLKEGAASGLSLPVAKNRTRLDSILSEAGRSDDGVSFEERLEGEVVVGPDEFRRLQQEMKALKNLLLKLRRELQADSSLSSPVGVGQSSLEEAPPTQMNVVCKERDDALAALECARAELRRREDTVTRLSSELETARFQNTSLRGEVEELGRRRDEMMDRVERLHAEKHKLEDRLAQAEQQALSLLSGDFDDLLCESIDAGSVKEERGQVTVDSTILSDGGKGENSDPESEAVVMDVTDAIN